MSQKVYFATTNSGKIETMKQFIGPSVDIEIADIHLIEPQADTVEEIVKIKGDRAFEKIKEPVIVQDSGFVIPSLNNFPGPYIKYILDSIGIEGILKLMEGSNDRECYFIGCCCFTSEDDQKIFVYKEASGEISHDIRGVYDDKAWGALWHIFIPEWSNGKTYTEIDHQTIHDHLKNSEHKNDFQQLGEYLSKKFS